MNFFLLKIVLFHDLLHFGIYSMDQDVTLYIDLEKNIDRPEIYTFCLQK